MRPDKQTRLTAPNVAHLKPMWIVFLTSEFVTEPSFAGGLANYLLRICLALRNAGHHPVVIVRSDKEERFHYRGIEVWRVKPKTHAIIRIVDKLTSKRFRQPLSIISGALAFSRKLKEAAKKRPLDIVQSASYQSTNLFLSKDIPCAVRISSYEPLWRKAYEKRLSMAQRLTEWLEVIALRRANGVFAPSRLLANKVENDIKVRVQTIEPPFIMDPLNHDTRMYERYLKGKQYLLFFGTIGLMKGCKTIADILQPLLRRYGDLYFVFVGVVESYNAWPMTEYIFNQAGSVRERVLCLGPMRHEALFPIIEMAQGVVLPSRIDNFPNTCLEAMYFGQIVVGTKGTSFEQLIEDGSSGFLCLPDNPDSLLEKTQKVLKLSEKERSSISEKAMMRIRELSPEKAIKQHIEFYEKLIHGRGS